MAVTAGSVVSLVAIQEIAGARRVWLPGWMRRRSLLSRFVIIAIERSVPWLAWCEQVLAPRRLMALRGKVARPIMGLAVLTLALVISKGHAGALRIWA
ncbi:MAG: exopolysaccharide biosynthesis protein [Bosea sp.]|nr:exopolysaccharide biosynthesis protein [Bosea sp. (in: a-proteobacteria)]